MITYTSVNSKFSATVQGDFQSANAFYAYSKSKTMLRLKRENQPQTSIFLLQFSGNIIPNVSYYTDPNGVLEIPLKNFVNKMIAAGHTSEVIYITLLEVSGNTVVDTLTLSAYPVEGISYNDLNAPRNKEMQDWIGAYPTDIIVPPNIIINPTQLNGVGAAGTIVESNFHTHEDKVWVWSEFAAGVGSTITATGARLNQLPIAAGSDILQLTDGSITKKWQLEKPDYCADLVCIRWKSMTGATRQHYFPIVGRIKSTDKAVSLVSAGDGYEVDKNAVDGIRCRLTGLTSYGYWYYMDLLQSSDVHAVIRPTYSIWETEISSAQTAVFVEAGEMEQPQGTGFFNFEFTLKLRHYDTV